MARNRFKVPILARVGSSQLNALLARLTDLDKKAGRAAVRKGMNEITKDVLWEARDHVKTASGLLKRALGRKVSTTRNGKRVVGVVKPRGGVWTAKPPDLVTVRRQRTLKNGKVVFYVNKWSQLRAGERVNPARYAHLVEFGRVGFTVKKKKVLAGGGVVYGKRVKSVAPHPFMRPAWANNEHKATPTLHRWLQQALVKAWLAGRARTPKARRR